MINGGRVNQKIQNNTLVIADRPIAEVLKDQGLEQLPQGVVLHNFKWLSQTLTEKTNKSATMQHSVIDLSNEEHTQTQNQSNHDISVPQATFFAPTLSNIVPVVIQANNVIDLSSSPLQKTPNDTFIPLVTIAPPTIVRQSSEGNITAPTTVTSPLPISTKANMSLISSESNITAPTTVASPLPISAVLPFSDKSDELKKQTHGT